MKTDEHGFVQELTGTPAVTFRRMFDALAQQLQLGLAPEEARLLQETASLAALCNIAFNSLEGHTVLADHGLDLLWLEHQYMHFLTTLRATHGWQSLPEPKRQWIDELLLRVVVEPENLGN